MNYFHRFGRRMAIPSSLQVSRELRALSADYDARQRVVDKERPSEPGASDDIVTPRQTSETE